MPNAGPDLANRLTQTLLGGVSAALDQACAYLKSAAVWGAGPARRNYRGGFMATRPGIHTGQLYRSVGVVAAKVVNGDIQGGIGDMRLLNSLQSPTFSVQGGRTIRHRDPQRYGGFGYWYYLEWGVQENPNYEFVPIALSPWSRARSKTKGGHGQVRNLAAKADIRGWGAGTGKGPLMRVAIASSPQFATREHPAGSGRVVAVAGQARLPFRSAQGERVGPQSRFSRNIAVGFMRRSRSGKHHPGVRPTYMFQRTSARLRQIVNQELGTRLSAFAQTMSQTFSRQATIKL